MALRREKSKLSNKRRESTDLFSDEPISNSTHTASTPIRINNRSEDEESPYFPCSTQEMREDVDVLWDYNSPQSRPKTVIVRKSKKKLNLPQSPKVPFRRHPSNNNEQIKQDFCKVREELQALRAEIAKPDHEESLILSPREEEVFNITQATDDHIRGFDHIIEEHPTCESDFEDPFNDDMDDKLILFSQQVESDSLPNKVGLECKKTRSSNGKMTSYGSDYGFSAKLSLNPNPYPLRNLNLGSVPTIMVNNCDTRAKNQHYGSNSLSKHASTVMKSNTTSSCGQNSSTTAMKVTSVQDSDVFNDSFDNVLSQMNGVDFDQLTQVVDMEQYKNDKVVRNTDKQCKVFPRSQSEDVVKFGSCQTVSGKVEWHRTQSFESYNNSQLSTEKLLEIERKRLEAKAKLEAKKKQDITITTIPECSDSPLKCSPEEIEKKRLQALAKLESKRQQEIIEKKKQEALKRREENRKKNSSQVKSSLTTRL